MAIDSNTTVPNRLMIEVLFNNWKLKNDTISSFAVHSCFGAFFFQRPTFNMYLHYFISLFFQKFCGTHFPFLSPKENKCWPLYTSISFRSYRVKFRSENVTISWSNEIHCVSIEPLSILQLDPEGDVLFNRLTLKFLSVNIYSFKLELINFNAFLILLLSIQVSNKWNWFTGNCIWREKKLIKLKCLLTFFK